MTKSDFIAALAEKNSMTKKDAEKCVAAVFGCLTDVLATGEKVQLTGFGVFEVRERAQREGKNPQNGEPMVIPASKSPAFKAGKSLKDIVNK